MHLTGILTFFDQLQVLRVVRLYPGVNHPDIGVGHGVGQLWVLANFHAGLANHVHVLDVVFPNPEPFQALVAILDRAQRRRMEVIRDKDLELATAGRMNQAVGRQFSELVQPLHFSFSLDQAVTQKLLNHLTIRALFSATSDRFDDSPGHGVGCSQVPDRPEIRQLNEIGVDQPGSARRDDFAIPLVADARHLVQVGVALAALVGQQNIAQLADDVLAFPLYDYIEVAVVESLFRQRTHLRAATDGDEVRMVQLGHTSNLIATGRFIDQRRHHQDVHTVQVFVGVDQATAVFKPNLPFVQERAFPLGQGAGQKQHALPRYGDIFKIPTGRRWL